MKSDNILHCEQCETDTGTLVSSELDITDCRKIENARGRLVCSYRETTPTADVEAPDDGTNTDNTPDDNVKDLEDGQNDNPDPKTEDDLDDLDAFDNPNDGLPGGSYRRDCSGCELKREGQLLACDYCKRDNGINQYTIAYVSGCKYFVNRDGVLRCDRTRSPTM